MGTDEAKRSEYRSRVQTMGKKEFTLQKMQEYGFWPKHLPTPYERQKNETPGDYQKRKALLKEYEKIAGEISKLYEDKKEINERLKSLSKEFDQTWDYEKIRKDVSQKIMQESIRRRAEQARIRENEKLRVSQAWNQHKAENIVFIGRGYSGGLNHFETELTKLEATGLPLIRDDKELALFLGIEYRKLRFLTYHRDVVSTDHYHRYMIPKRSGGYRNIAAPKPLLKAVQKAILTGILEYIEVSGSANGFIKGKSVVSGAVTHTPNPQLLVNMDIENFFPSITFFRVRGLFRSLGYCGLVASLLAMLCTDCERMPIEVKGEVKYVKTSERVLPQGSPASPMITNILCRHLDKRIGEMAAQFGFSFSRYADDISITFAEIPKDKQIRQAVGTVMGIIENEGFVVNKKKTRYLRRNNRQLITGIVINNQEPGVPKAWVKRLRAAIHNASKLRLQGEIPQGLLNEISGGAAWLKSVNAVRYEKIINAALELQRSNM